MSPAAHTTSVQTQDGCTAKPLSIVPEGIVFPPTIVHLIWCQNITHTMYY